MEQTNKMYNPILLSNRLCTVKDKEEIRVAIPTKGSDGETVHRFQIHFFAEKGVGEVFFSSVDNRPALRIPEGRSWNARFQGLNECGVFIARVCLGSVLWYTVEQLR